MKQDMILLLKEKSLYRIKQEWLYPVALFGVLLVFTLFKFKYHINTGVIDLEEFFKLKFTRDGLDVFGFLPGGHPTDSFFGHPGMMSLLYHLFSKVFGLTLYSSRVFCLLMSLFCVCSYYLLISSVSSKGVALCSALSFLFLPMFQVQSIKFLNELGSFGFVFLSLYFAVKERWLLYALLGVVATLYLESAVSYYLIGIIYFTFINRPLKITKPVMYSVVPALAIILFLFFEWYYTGNYSNHTTNEIVSGRVFNPFQILIQIDWGDLWHRRLLTVTENVSIFVPMFILILSLLHVTYRWHLSMGFHMLLGPAILHLLFYSFLSAYEGGRDFYAGYAFLFYYLYVYIEKLPFARGLRMALVFCSFGFSFYRLTLDEGSMFETTYKQYQRADEFLAIRGALDKIDLKVPCLEPRDVSMFFCSKYFFPHQKKIRITGKEIGYFFVIATETSQKEVVNYFSEKGFKMVDNRYLGHAVGDEFYYITFTEYL